MKPKEEDVVVVGKRGLSAFPRTDLEAHLKAECFFISGDVLVEIPNKRYQTPNILARIPEILGETP